MRKLFATTVILFFSSTISAEADTTYNPITGVVNIPQLKVVGDTTGSAFAVQLQQRPDFSFSVSSVNPASPTTYDGRYQGNCTLVPGWNTCLADGYSTDMTVTSSSFTAIVTRHGGQQSGTIYTVQGTVHSDGRFDDYVHQGVGSASFFQGKILGNSAVGTDGAYTSGATTNSGICLCTFNLEKAQ